MLDPGARQAGFAGLLAAAIAAVSPESCSHQSQTAAPEAVRPAVLMVTWLVPGQPPQTTQTVMSGAEACEKARAATVAAGEAAKSEREAMNERDKAEASADLEKAAQAIRASGGLLAGPGPEDERKLRGVPLPQVSAYCIER